VLESLATNGVLAGLLGLGFGALGVFVLMFIARQGLHKQLFEVREAFNQQQKAREASEQNLADLQTTNAGLQRDLASAQAIQHGLNQRLEELRAELQERTQSLQKTVARELELEKNLAALTASHNERLAAYDRLEKSIEQSGKRLKTEFENLANVVLEQKGKAFANQSQSSLEALLKPFREQIQGFQQRVNQVHDETLKGNASLSTQIRQIADVGLKMSAEAQSLASALKGDKKLVGGWGEAQLEQTLQQAGLVRGEHYEAQARFADGQGSGYRYPDFVIKLPDGKHIIIDSKVSLVAYDRAVAAAEELQRIEALDDHVKALRQHVDDLRKKDYSNLIGLHSPSFVLMFLPIEAAYIAALKHDRALYDEAYRANVVLVSHTTLVPILKTVANLWMLAHSNEEAHEISERAGDIYNQVVIVAEHLKRMGDSLAAVGNHYNRTVTSLAGRQGLYGKVQRFSELSARATKTMPDLQAMHNDIYLERLSLIVDDDSDPE